MGSFSLGGALSDLGSVSVETPPPPSGSGSGLIGILGSIGQAAQEVSQISGSVAVGTGTAQTLVSDYTGTQIPMGQRVSFWQSFPTWAWILIALAALFIVWKFIL